MPARFFDGLYRLAFPLRLTESLFYSDLPDHFFGASSRLTFSMRLIRSLFRCILPDTYSFRFAGSLFPFPFFYALFRTFNLLRPVQRTLWQSSSSSPARSPRTCFCRLPLLSRRAKSPHGVQPSSLPLQSTALPDGW